MSSRLSKAVRYDGIRETLFLIASNAGYRIGLRPSDTFLFVNDGEWNFETGNIEYESFWLSDEEQLDSFTILGRIDNQKAAKWLNYGNRLFVVVDGKDIIAYGCARSGSYDINENIRIMLAEDEIWLGPVFVNHKYRNRGINRFQISSIVRAERDRGIRRIFTGISSKNYPSIISYMRNGFSIIGFYHIRDGIFCRRKEKLFDLTEDQYLQGKLVGK